MVSHRINVTLPKETLQMIEQFAPKGERSRFINEAIQAYISQIQKDRLRQQLKEGAIFRAERDLNLADEWFTLEEEVWLKKAE